jgi:tetratricopeptide (TPR) repeat protein
MTPLPFDREETLQKAERALRSGRVDIAIADYTRVVDDQPADWTTATTLADLLMRAGRAEQAVVHYARIADHYLGEGFYPKAAALFKKILTVTPGDDQVQVKLGELASRQGLVSEAKSLWTAAEAARRARGDVRGADDLVVRLGSLDPSDVPARIAGAHALAAAGDRTGAAARFRAIHADLVGLGRKAEALDALRESVALNPDDREARVVLANEAVAAGDPEGARTYLDREVAAGDPALLLALAEIELRAGRLDEARPVVAELIAAGAAARDRIVELGWRLAPSDAAAAFVCIDAAADAAIAESDYEAAAALLQEFVSRLPGQIGALLKLVEVSVDGGLESTMYDAQAQLADAYLEAGQAAEARVISEDLVAREPWERAHIDRFRRALVMLRVPNPDAVIAERLGGQTPFMATDAFADVESRTRSASEPIVPGSPDAGVERRADPPRAIRSGEIDLTIELGDLESGSPAGPHAESRSSEPDPAELVGLGRTYLEMGMVDEAIGALTNAVRSSGPVFDAAALLARVYKERGELATALEWFERAAESPAPTPEAGRSLLYDLGSALEDAREHVRALAVFLELQADAPEYRDVEARVTRLTRA